ncbi:MAG: branched-chain amino acid ABC transporter permease [Desulfomonilaceae bacterium]
MMSAEGQTSSSRIGWLVVLGVGICLLVAPHVLDRYPRYILTEVIIWGLFALGFDIIFGKMGLLNFGMSSFFGLGAYGFVFAVKYVYPSVWLGIFSGMAFAMIFSIAVGLIVSRFSSHYFVVFTIVISMILFLLAMNLRTITGADEGINIRLPNLQIIAWEFSLRSPITKYYLVLGVAAVAFLVVWLFFDSPVGRAVVAIRENEARAQMIGYNTAYLKLVAFTLSGTVAGLAGALYPLLNSTTSAELFFWILSGKAVLWTVVGGAGTLWGPFLGAALLVSAEDALSSWLVDFYPILVGVLLIAIILLAPKGMLGTVFQWVAERRASMEPGGKS